MDDFSGLSPRCTLLSASDDFSGDYLISPMSPMELCRVSGGEIRLNRFVQVGAGTVILPAVVMAEGVAVGAMSLVKQSLAEWGIYAGVPAQRIKERSRACRALAEKVSKE